MVPSGSDHYRHDGSRNVDVIRSQFAQATVEWGQRNLELIQSVPEDELVTVVDYHN